jgi:DNA-binding response OmpR family regulator
MKGPKKRILLVDDEASFTRLLKLHLEETGEFEVRVENQGSRAAVAAREFQPDLIFLDVIMPDSDGGEIALALKKDPAIGKVPVVFLTAILSKQEADDLGGYIAGNPFLAKPVSTREVIAAIRRQLSRPRELLESRKAA